MGSKEDFKIWKSRSFVDVQLDRFLIDIHRKHISEFEILSNGEAEFFFKLWHYANNILLIILLSLLFYEMPKY